MKDETNMANSVETLGDLFSAKEGQADQESREKLESHEKLQGLDEKLDAKPGEVRPGEATEKIMGTLGDLLDISVIEILIKVWNEGKLFRKYLDPDTYPANETIEITLVKHTITSVHRPYIEIRFDDARVDRIDFEISLTLQLQGAVLEIRGGRIIKVRAGDCTAAGEVKCEGFKLLSRQSRSVKLRGVVEFDDGITIAA